MGQSEKVVVFHVGLHKTGTTMLQSYLSSNINALHRHRIMHVPRFKLARYIGWGDRLEDEPEPFLDQIKEFEGRDDVDMLVMSHEDVIGHPFARGGDGRVYPNGPANMRLLREILGDRHVKVILSVRPQNGFLESYYLQTVQEGGYRTFEQWLEGVDMTALSWSPIADAVTDQFGEANVSIIDFREITNGQEAYIKMCLHVINPTLTFDSTYEFVRNRSISEKGMLMALGANRHLRSATERREMRDFLQRYFSNADYPRASLLDDETEQALLARYGPEYEQLVSRQSPAEPSAGPAGRSHA